MANRFYDVAKMLDDRLRGQALNALGDFRASLAGETMAATGRFPNLGEHSEIRFALEDLGPRRITAAQSHLATCDDRDYNALIDFLKVTAEGVRYDVTHAEDEFDVGEALLRALDSLHDFLIAHELVGPLYRYAQGSREGFVFQIGDLPRKPKLSFRLLRAGEEMVAPAWQRPKQENPLGGRGQFTRDEPKQTVTLA